jgi:cellulose biosynthesis protein BcsQ
MAEPSSTVSLAPRETERPSSVLTTFYSFKGGVGRTQSLYNVAARLTALRRKVLMVDVDLEAPGLSITLDEERRRSKEGVAEIATALLEDLKTAFAEQEDLEYLQALKARYTARIQRALHELEPPMSPKNEDLAERLQREMDVQIPAEGSLSLLSVGRVGTDYTQRVAHLPLAEAYDDDLDAANRAVVNSLVEDFQTPLDRNRLRTRGHVFAVLFRELLRTATAPNREDETFDHVLIDSRSGLADVGGLCLLGLAETRVVLTGLNEQNVTGTKMVLDDIAEVDDDARKSSHLITVFSPVPEGEVDLLAERLESAKDTLGVSDDQVRLLHYHPRIALEEKPFAKPFHEYTRIYDEYEDLTDHLLALTGSDARSLVSDALDRFREEDEDPKDETSTEEKNRYEKLVDELIPAAFLDEDRVESVVDGLCSQIRQSGPYEMSAVPLFDLWVALSPNEFRVSVSAADFYKEVSQEISSTEHAKSLLQRNIDLIERVFEMKMEKNTTWHNWGTDLARLSDLVDHADLDRADFVYQEALHKFQEVAEVTPDKPETWDNSEISEIFLIRRSRMLPQNRNEEARRNLTSAIEKLRESRSTGGDPLPLFWLIIALVERGADGDVEEAAELLDAALEEAPEFVSWFDSEDAEAVRAHPELREILDEYRERVDEDELEDVDNPDEVDPTDLGE